jgi:hypothetical protein
MTFDSFLLCCERQALMRWFLRITEPLDRPIGNDIYVRCYWLRLSTWRAMGVLFPLALIFGWYVVPHLALLTLYFAGLLH